MSLAVILGGATHVILAALKPFKLSSSINLGLPPQIFLACQFLESALIGPDTTRPRPRPHDHDHHYHHPPNPNLSTQSQPALLCAFILIDLPALFCIGQPHYFLLRAVSQPPPCAPWLLLHLLILLIPHFPPRVFGSLSLAGTFNLTDATLHQHYNTVP
jgi:hypothetical protein